MKSRIPDVSIIIVHYQREDVLWRCLASVPAGTILASYEVIVVDNGSLDGFKKRLQTRFPHAHYLRSSSNQGYGGGNNLGASVARGEFFFILNPDTEVEPGSIDTLVNSLRSNLKCAVVAPTLIHEDGTLFTQQGSLTLTPLRVLAAHSIFHAICPENPVSRKFWLTGVDQRRDRRVEVVPGSAFLVRRDVFEEVGGFDTRFFLYFEEYDFCRQVLQRGYEIWMSGSSRVMHVWEATTSGVPRAAFSRRSLLQYLQKYYGRRIGLFWYLLSQISKYQLLLICLTILTLLSWVFLG